MSAVLPDGLTIAGTLPRESPLDAIVLPVRLKADTTETMRGRLEPNPTDIGSVRLQPDRLTSIEELVRLLGDSPSIGTGSVRRIAQLSRLFPSARFAGIRGNLDTRLRKLDEGAHDALVLAAAGLNRLGFSSRISLAVPADACVPAPGQGIVAIEIRSADGRARDAVALIGDAAAADALAAERALVGALGGGCQTPVGAIASVDGDALEMLAVVVALDGTRIVRGRGRAPRGDAAALGTRVGRQLIADGAGDILAEAQRSQS
jgi:hydroxymethylbilane synthase